MGCPGADDNELGPPHLGGLKIARLPQRDLQKTPRVEQVYFGPGDDSLGRGREIPSVGIA